jgi:lipoyl-dependent peroxiredoxin
MATVRTAEAHWEGSLFEGQGEVELVSSGLGHFEVSWTTRAEQPDGHTSPEELIAAAHSTCFNMALSNVLTEGGTPPTSLDTRADVTFDPPNITGIKLIVTGVVPGITA